MFCNATDQGRKEAEQTVCQGHRKELPKLDLEADLSTIQLVSPHTSKEELQSFVPQGIQAAETSWISTWRTRIDGGGGVFL